MNARRRAHGRSGGEAQRASPAARGLAEGQVPTWAAGRPCWGAVSAPCPLPSRASTAARAEAGGAGDRGAAAPVWRGLCRSAPPATRGLRLGTRLALLPGLSYPDPTPFPSVPLFYLRNKKKPPGRKPSFRSFARARRADGGHRGRPRPDAGRIRLSALLWSLRPARRATPRPACSVTAGPSAC